MERRLLVTTFSIVALDRQTGEVGVAVASRFLAVGAVVPWAQAGVGGVVTQAWANLSFGPGGLRLLAEGHSATEVVRTLTDADEGRAHRQVGIVDAQGRAAAWTGRECFAWAGHRTGDGFTCQGNILSGPGVVEAMAGTFSRTAGALPERLLAALSAGQDAGGDSRGQQSAALLVVKEKGSYGGYLDRYIDLRVDDDSTPIARLRGLLELHRLYFVTGEPVLISLTADIVREVQEILRQRGFTPDPPTGIYDDRTKDAFRRLCSVENFEERWREDDRVDQEILHYLRRRYGRGP